MKGICTISHEIPLGGGRYKAYEAGRMYEGEDLEKKYFFEIVDRPRAAARETIAVPEETNSGAGETLDQPGEAIPAAGDTEAAPAPEDADKSKRGRSRQKTKEVKDHDSNT